MVVVKTARGLTTRVPCPDINFPRFQEWKVLLPNRRRDVNIILKLLTTNPLLLELHVSPTGQDVTPLEELWRVRHPIVDFRLHRTTETDHRLFEIFRRAKSRT
jgi:hypothetical protein